MSHLLVLMVKMPNQIASYPAAAAMGRLALQQGSTFPTRWFGDFLVIGTQWRRISCEFRSQARKAGGNVPGLADEG